MERYHFKIATAAAGGPRGGLRGLRASALSLPPLREGSSRASGIQPPVIIVQARRRAAARGRRATAVVAPMRRTASGGQHTDAALAKINALVSAVRDLRVREARRGADPAADRGGMSRELELELRGKVARLAKEKRELATALREAEEEHLRTVEGLVARVRDLQAQLQSLREDRGGDAPAAAGRGPGATVRPAEAEAAGAAAGGAAAATPHERGVPPHAGGGGPGQRRAARPDDGGAPSPASSRALSLSPQPSTRGPSPIAPPLSPSLAPIVAAENRAAAMDLFGGGAQGAPQRTAAAATADSLFGAAAGGAAAALAGASFHSARDIFSAPPAAAAAAAANGPAAQGRPPGHPHKHAALRPIVAPGGSAGRAEGGQMHAPAPRHGAGGAGGGRSFEESYVGAERPLR